MLEVVFQNIRLRIEGLIGLVALFTLAAAISIAAALYLR